MFYFRFFFHLSAFRSFHFFFFRLVVFFFLLPYLSLSYFHFFFILHSFYIFSLPLSLSSVARSILQRVSIDRVDSINRRAARRRYLAFRNEQLAPAACSLLVTSG